MKKIGTLLVAGSIALALAGCGAREDQTGDNSGQPTFNPDGSIAGGGTTGQGAAVARALSVRVLSDVNRIETGGSDVAAITALVTDDNNNAVANQTVSFSATGGVLQDITTVTDVNGEAKATLRLLQDFRKQDIVVTITADSFTGQVMVSASGSNLKIVGPSNLVEGAQADLTVTLTAGNGEPIGNQLVALTSAVGNVITPAEGVTDSDGNLSATVASTNGNDTITAVALEETVNKTFEFSVSTDSLEYETADIDDELEVGEPHDVDVTWTTQGQPVAGRPLRFSITAGQLLTPATVTTDASGKARVTVTSNSAGIAQITVEDAADGEPSNRADVEFVASTPAKANVSASKTRILANGTSKITALITDVNGNPVKGRQVGFTSADLKGGRLLTASATTEADGTASVDFQAGSEATAFEEVQIAAQVEGSQISDSIRLTVAERVLNVTIGTSNDVSIVDEFGTQYFVPFVVQVADGSGTPLSEADVALSIKPILYGKGRMVLVDDRGVENDGSETWSPDHWSLDDEVIGCTSEDTNGNRVLDTTISGATEDRNGNGSLDPQDPASLAALGDAALTNGSVETDATGSGYFRMIYPASNSLWAYVEITARAEALGAEAEDSFFTTLLLPSTEAEDEKSLPANYTSPYGTVPDCTSDD